MVTQSEFILEYCKKSKITEKELNELSQCAMPCECDYKDCKGWKMTHFTGKVKA